ncbi:hypothetical protein NQ318_022423 [Aromia moschata]|uniref:Protein sleepless n=1 Tax=Aromia moschata TaxID=1265417 RepID=A0AAV8Z6X6_9CUCU|nr:hypothetical protein NQ318_022423 [Aromia moschata]
MHRVFKTQVGYGDKSIVVRKCRLVSDSLKSGECPDDTNNSDTIYCGTCDTDGCNDSNAIKSNAFLAITISLFLVQARRIVELKLI